MKVQTDTATIVIYDLSNLKHRLNDDCDWWASPSEELKEINDGNVFFIGTGIDGAFKIEIEENLPPKNNETLSAVIKNQSGKLFIGGGEDVTGEEIEPTHDDGCFITLPKGNYVVTTWLHDGNIKLNLSSTNRDAINAFTSSPSIA